VALGLHQPPDWTALLSTTFHNYRKSLTDNIFNSRPLLNFYMSKGRLRELSGGISIVEPIIFGEGDVRSYSGYDAIPIAPQDDITAAQYAWRQLVATIIISGLEEAQNNSKEMAVNLLEAKIMQAEETLKTRLNRMLFGIYVATAGPPTEVGKLFTGLPMLIDDTQIVGGIDPASNAWWKSVVNATGGSLDATALEKALRNAYNATSDAGNDRVDAIFTNAVGFGGYEGGLTPQVRYTDTAKANLGFQNLMFKDVPMFWDFDCPGNIVTATQVATTSPTTACYFGLNSKYVGLVVHSDRNFKQSAFTDNLTGSVTQGGSSATASALDARVSFITTFGEQTTRNRRRHFKLTNITPT